MSEAALVTRGMFASSNRNTHLSKPINLLTMNRFSSFQSFIGRKAAFIAFFLVLVAGAGTVDAASALNTVRPLGNMEEAIVYQRTLNPYIGITVEHATGAAYTIADKNGKIILKGKINSDKAFFVATARLPKGSYQFRVAGALMQHFIIQ